MTLSTVLIAGLGLAGTVRADSDIDAKAKDVARSLVSVEFTIHNENISREESAQGIVIHKDGIILISGSTIPESLPKEWIKDLKVRLPSKNFTSVPVTFLGRTQDRQFAFLKTEKPIDAPVFSPGDTVPTVLGQEVFSIAMLGKSSGYPTAVGRTVVKSMLDVMHPLANTGSFGLTCGNSPVFDFQSGKFVGMTIPSSGEAMYIRDPSGRGMQPIELLDVDQGSAYLPAEQIKTLFENIPTKPFQSPRAWLAVDGLTGISEDIRTLRDIKQPAGVMVGSVIANEAADKAGIQSQDLILAMDGKPFSENPVPEMMVQHFARTLEKHQPGDKITLGILRDGKKMDIPVTLGTSPKLASEQTFTYSAKVGVETRDLVYSDAYTRRLPQDTKGVMIALVKNGAPASLGSTPLHIGDLVTKVNEETIENQEQFLAAMKKIEAAPDQKEAVFVVIQSDGNTQVCHVDLTK